MPVFDPPRRAVADVLDVFGEVLGAGALATTDALSRALGSPPPGQLMSPQHQTSSTTGAGTRHDAQVVGLEGQLEAVADGAVEAVAGVMLEGAALAAALLARIVGQSNSAAPTRSARTSGRALVVM